MGPWDHLIFMMGLPILVRRHLYIEKDELLHWHTSKYTAMFLHEYHQSKTRVIYNLNMSTSYQINGHIKMHAYRTHYLSNLNFQQDTNLSSAKGLRKSLVQYIHNTPDSKVHGANMGATGVLLAQDGSHVGLMNLAIWDGRCPISQDNH